MFDRESIQQHSLDIRQFVGFRAATLPNGMRIVEAYNAAGLHFTILPDRGFDLWTAAYQGVPLTWVSPGSPFPPDDGATWLGQFNGGLLTTCGLRHVGPPENDAQTGAFRDLHGRFSRLRAGETNTGGVWTDSHSYTATLTSTVHEGQLHGEQIELRRTYHLPHAAPYLLIEDTITNQGDQPEPFMLLYHVNVGYPLVRAGARLITPHQAVYDRAGGGRADEADWSTYAAAAPRYAEQVYFHHLRGDADEQTAILLHNDEIGIRLGYDLRQLPYFTQWKNTRNGMYVNGIEPGNCIPEGQNAARQHNRLETLAAGEQRSYTLKIEIIAGREALQTAATEITGLGGAPAGGFKFGAD